MKNHEHSESTNALEEKESIESKNEEKERALFMDQIEKDSLPLEIELKKEERKVA